MNPLIIIFNPRSADAKHRIPNSILQIGASIHGTYHYEFIDGNLEDNPEKKILALIRDKGINILV